MNLNLEIYGKQTVDTANFGGSRMVYFTKDYIKENDHILDIGGASGVFLEVINQNIPIRGTIIDMDADCIKLGKERFPHFNFIRGMFPYMPGYPSKFDIVSMQALFPQLEDWKGTILKMAALSKRYINFSCLLKTQGRTVTDRDVSFVYYFDTGKRLPQVINNIYEILNFLCIEEVRAKKIQFFGLRQGFTCGMWEAKKAILKEIGDDPPEGRHINGSLTSHTFRAIEPFGEILGNFMVELFSPEDNPKRMGGLGISKGEVEGYKFFRPEIEVVIDQTLFLQIKGEFAVYNASLLIDKPSF